MIRAIVLLVLLAPSICVAETSGYLFFSKYSDSEKTDLEGRDIAYTAGIHIEIATEVGTTFFLNEETLIRDINDRGSFPKQINYKLGIKHRYKSVEISIVHECLHPVDGASMGEAATDYNMIEGRYYF